MTDGTSNCGTSPAVFARMVALPGRRAELLSALQPLIASGHQETGTVTYLAHESTDHPDVLWFYARFSDEGALRDHQMHEAALSDAAAEVGTLLAEAPQIDYGVVISEKRST